MKHEAKVRKLRLIAGACGTSSVHPPQKNPQGWFFTWPTLHHLAFCWPTGAASFWKAWKWGFHLGIRDDIFSIPTFFFPKFGYLWKFKTVPSQILKQLANKYPRHASNEGSPTSFGFPKRSPFAGPELKAIRRRSKISIQKSRSSTWSANTWDSRTIKPADPFKDIMQIRHRHTLGSWSMKWCGVFEIRLEGGTQELSEGLPTWMSFPLCVWINGECCQSCTVSMIWNSLVLFVAEKTCQRKSQESEANKAKEILEVQSCSNSASLSTMWLGGIHAGAAQSQGSADPCAGRWMLTYWIQ